jgi:aromatic ring-cleaving dioxygenase
MDPLWDNHDGSFHVFDSLPEWPKTFMLPNNKPSYEVHFDEKLRSGEVFWYNWHREGLKSKGYVLRPIPGRMDCFLEKH